MDLDNRSIAETDPEAAAQALRQLCADGCTCDLGHGEEHRPGFGLAA
jgi:hypothetical protein